MALTHNQLRQKFAQFWTEKNHKEVPPIPLIPQNDPTTLFTGSGMQQLVPFLLGEPHPLGEKLFNIQPCFRAQDIEEVGNNRHTTSFEMMGNWSLGTYFKKEQLPWLFQFLVEDIALPPEKLYVTVFKGDSNIPADSESIEIWQKVFQKYGIEAKIGEHIFQYDATKNWWSRAGTPDQMPVGEPGGPSSEVFYDFGPQYKFHENSPWKDEICHLNCDCGRFIEIGNSVFMTYRKMAEGKFTELPKKNVDFGGGLERILAAANDDPDVFKTDIFSDIIEEIKLVTNKEYSEEQNKVAMRVIADHLKAATFLIKQGVTPSNKEHGYILRRLLRRSLLKIKSLKKDIKVEHVSAITTAVLNTYQGIYFDPNIDGARISDVIDEEMKKFDKTISQGIKEINRFLVDDASKIDAKIAFNLYQSYGFPLEITEEILRNLGHKIDRKQFQEEFNKHKELSRTSSAGKFKGGLADHSDQVLKYHTATHLLHQALFDLLGQVRQEGSNITAERLRFDFSANFKPDMLEIKRVEGIINEKITAAIPVNFQIMPKAEAEKVGAKSFFREKYPDMVKVYYVGNDLNNAYSKEFCGGPHVKNTKEIGNIQIYKFEKIGSNLYRIYAK